jgi:tol-pal system protein YbgF
MVDRQTQSKTLMAMTRSAPLLALACALWANSAHAQTSESDLVTRIDRLEEEIRNLSGNVEQLQYRNQQLEQMIQRLQGGAPAAEPSRSAGQYAPPPGSQYSPPPQYQPPSQYPAAQYPSSAPQYSPPPGQASGQAPGGVASAVPMAPSDAASSAGRHGDAFDPSVNPAAPGAPRPLGASTAANEPPPPVSPPGGPREPGQPLDLSSPSDSAGGVGGSRGGDLPPPPQANLSAPSGAPPVQPLPNTPKDEYDLAYGYVQHRNFGLAEDTFRDFLHKYPTDKLAPDAQYWLGESLFQDRQYHDAAESFLAVSTKYENAPRAPDALLRLGQSLAALGEKEAACASLGEVLRKYPHASVSVKQGVDREQKRTHC